MTILGLFLNNEMRTGANRRYLELMESIAEKGHSVFVLMNKSLAYESVHFARIDLDINYVRGSFPPASWLFSKNIKKHIVEIAEACGRIDWIHIHGDTHLKAALFLAKHFNAPLFFAYRCNDITRARILRKRIRLTIKERILSLATEKLNAAREKIVAKNSRIVTFQNTSDRDEYIKRTGFSLTNTIVIPGNIGLPRFEDKWKNANTSTSVKHLLYVGVLSGTKGFQFVLEALSILKNRGYGNLRLTALGKNNSEDEIKRIFTSLNIDGMVDFPGYQNPFPYLAKADLMVYPTLYDAFPDTILEALHAGCPVIATRIGGIPDILEHDFLLFPLGDSTRIADIIENCIRDSGYYQMVREKCERNAGRFRFDWADRFINAMESGT